MSAQVVESGSGRRDRYGSWLLILGGAMVLGVLVQGFLGSQGFFNANTSMINAHEMLANVLFLIGLVQLILAVLAFRAGTVDPVGLALHVILLVLLVVQIALGYGTRDSADATAWHIPNGVLLMGISTAIAVMNWKRRPAA